LSFLNQTAFQVSDVRFREILVFAHKSNGVGPKILVSVLLQTVAHYFRFPDVRRWLSSVWIIAK
jgi:hypothetical protein